jgi:large conductance mechanosensitive channel
MGNSHKEYLVRRREEDINMLDEFKKFLGGGNVIDLAVGVIVGGAMGKIIQSFVDEMILPLVGLLPIPGNFNDAYLTLKKGGELFKEGEPLKLARDHGAVVLGYGQFISVVLTVVLTAFAVFMVVKAVNKMKLAQASEVAPPPPQETLLTEIRDLLKK